MWPASPSIGLLGVGFVRKGQPIKAQRVSATGMARHADMNCTPTRTKQLSSHASLHSLVTFLFRNKFGASEVVSSSHFC